MGGIGGMGGMGLMGGRCTRWKATGAQFGESTILIDSYSRVERTKCKWRLRVAAPAPMPLPLKLRLPCSFRSATGHDKRCRAVHSAV